MSEVGGRVESHPKCMRADRMDRMCSENWQRISEGWPEVQVIIPLAGWPEALNGRLKHQQAALWGGERMAEKL